MRKRNIKTNTTHLDSKPQGKRIWICRDCDVSWKAESGKCWMCGNNIDASIEEMLDRAVKPTHPAPPRNNFPTDGRPIPLRGW